MVLISQPGAIHSQRSQTAAAYTEGATGLGGSLTARLAGDGVAVVAVPAKLARRVRLLSTGHGRKTGQADALPAGIAAHTATRLSTGVADEATAALRALTGHRDDLVRSRTQTTRRLHALLAQLLPASVPRGKTADTAADALRSIRPRAVLAALRQVAAELLSEVRRPGRRIARATAALSAAVAASGTTLTDLHGIGDVTARARGKRNPHATRIVAHAWIRVIWACWHTGTPYNPAAIHRQQ
jgi:transposase